jgi:hypothetical protein
LFLVSTLNLLIKWEGESKLLGIKIVIETNTCNLFDSTTTLSNKYLKHKNLTVPGNIILTGFLKSLLVVLLSKMSCFNVTKQAPVSR